MTNYDIMRECYGDEMQDAMDAAEAPADVTFGAGEDFIPMGRTDDGSERVGRTYFVVATHADGRRWRLYTGSDRIVFEQADIPEGGYEYVEVNKLAKAQADAYAEALRYGMSGREAAASAGTRWVEDVPVYGSESHDEFALYDEDDWALHAA